MKKSFAQRDEKLERYAVETFAPEDDVLREVRVRSQRHGLPEIQVGSMDALHLEVVARAIGARKAVEIGTLGGYSGISIARGLAVGGKLYTFEYEPKNAEVARESFAKAGLSDRVEIVVGRALENLDKYAKQGPFDLVFIDADKVSYPAYLDWAWHNLRVGGVVLGDNTFGFGMIADERIDDAEDAASIAALREFNEQAAESGRFRATIIPTGEGLTMAVKIR